MKSQLYTIKILILLCAVCGFSIDSNSQNDPFNCAYDAYLFQYNDVFAVDLASGNYQLVATDVDASNINAAAYNPTDGYLWGYLRSNDDRIIRIGNDFTTTIYTIPQLNNSGYFVGAISPNGIYYLKGSSNKVYKVDINPNSANFGQYISSQNISPNITIQDWAFNAVDGQLYAVEKNTNKLYRINPNNLAKTDLGVVPILSGNNYTYGAVYFDADGRFYVSANETGTIYVIQNVQDVSSPADMDSNLFAFGPSSASNDGARCPTAPVAQEICGNGIDDDGDGLIDCDDPSCSGFGDCAVIEPPTSGGNGGGLESNNRLSEQINQRNFNRAKTGYNFDRATAPRAIRDLEYAQRNANNSFTLQDFIPLDIIGETEAIESSPADLVNITNATEIYAVDYMNEDTPFATVLALKTENGVYEHTKYICDRLLGAELLSVSTITINEQPFIKSIIKNVDGTHEFVLSLSAKLTNNEENFGVESHWNIDQYETNTTFYNFQIWANNVDDLYRLGEEVLNLLDVERPINQYDLSTPPTVFVRKGKYINGGLELQIVNTNGTDAINLDAGYRTTETTTFNSMNSTIDLSGNYITNVFVNTGNLFDIGFRIGDGIATPDDLFMSDGPWGIDDSQAGTTVNDYIVSENNFTFDTSDFPIERNVTLRANTDTYVAAYRALTPRFSAVDFTAFNSLKLSARGTGNLEIAFVKESITNWEDQYKMSIALSDTTQEYTLALADFVSANGSNPVLNDVVTIVFTMASEDGTMRSKIMNLENLRFSQSALSLDDYNIAGGTNIAAKPNPFQFKTNITFLSPENETVKIAVYDQLGNKIYLREFNAVAGRNRFSLEKGNLSSGLYFCRIISENHKFNTLKLIIN